MIKIDKNIYSDYQIFLENEELEENNSSAADYVDSFENGGYNGLSSLMCYIINTKEGLRLCCDEQDSNYGVVFYPAVYPWQVNEKMRTISEDDLDNIFRKYVNIITKSPLLIMDMTI